MGRPTTRILTILELLQTHGRMSGPELAQRLGVEPRSIRRYIVHLEDLGIPITTERGRLGAYMLVAGFKLPPMTFTNDEALALSVGLLAARGLGLADAAPAVAGAQAKLERVMPPALRKRVREIDETVALDFARAESSRDNTALVALSTAAQESRRVRMAYESSEGKATARDFDTYGLVYRSGRWYAVGHCHLRRGLRTFRLDRVTSVQPGEARFRRPANFDALAHLADSLATMPRAHAVELLLKTDLATARREIPRTIGIFEPHADGVLMSSQADDLDQFARELSRWPFEFEIRRPAALREALRQHADRLRRAAAGPRSAKPAKSVAAARRKP